MFLVKNNKSSFYQIVYFIDGKRTTHSTKKTNEQEALQYLEEFKKSLSLPSGVFDSISLPTESGCSKITTDENSLTLSIFKEEYLEYCNPVKSKKYIDSIAFSFKQFISLCGNRSLTEIDIRTVDKFINSTFTRTERGAHLYYRSLKAAFNKAVEWNYIPVNPFAKVKFPKLSNTFPVFISEDELLIILANTPHQHLKDIFTVAFYTGLRLSELINMQWNWIEFLQNQITVKCTDEFLTKSKKERIVSMSEKVKAILFRRFNSASHNPGEVVFYNLPAGGRQGVKGKILYPDAVSRRFRKIVRKSNLSEKIHFHTLRHSFASLPVLRRSPSDKKVCHYM
jgi:integrase